MSHARFQGTAQPAAAPNPAFATNTPVCHTAMCGTGRIGTVQLQGGQSGKPRRHMF